MGKGRQLAALVLENSMAGRRKHIWLSVSNDLAFDARRDLKDLCQDCDDVPSIEVYQLNKEPYGKLKVKEPAVIFSTYASLIAGKKSSGGKKKQTRLDQLVQWCGGNDFDGCLLFDECHKAKNLSKGTKVGQAVRQRRLVSGGT